MKRYSVLSYPSVWLVLLLSLALPTLACSLTDGAATAVPATDTPSPVFVPPTDTPTPEPTNPPTPTEAAKPKVSPTRRVALPTNTPSPVPPTVVPTVDPKASVPTGNLLVNPGFEGAYQSYLGKTEFNVAQGWIPWFLESGFPPEFKPAEPPYFLRIHSGERAQQYFKSFGTYTAGVYQKVRVAPGVTLRFSAYGQGWSHDGSGCPIEESCNPANMGMRIGIDPLGGSNPRADSVKWSPAQSPTSGWAPFSVEAVSENDVVTVYTWASPNEPRRNQDTYWDDAVLEAIP